MATDAPIRLTKGVPSLAQWFGDGTRAEGFEEWVRDTVLMEQAATTPDEAACVRLTRTLAIACMEAYRLECDQHGRDAGSTFTLLARACGVAIMVPILSLCDEAKNPPLRRIARQAAKEFEQGAMLMIEGNDRERAGR